MFLDRVAFVFKSNVSLDDRQTKAKRQSMALLREESDVCAWFKMEGGKISLGVCSEKDYYL